MKPDFSMRRRVLQGGLAACSLFLPAPWAWVRAQSAGAVKLLRAPKVALVVGNAAYRSVPALRNPGNDSAAIAQALRASGFEVTLAQDATRREMLDAFEAYAKTLAARQSVGLFYFAGHGVQLQWQNYLLPVDAKVETAAQVAAQCVDVMHLMGGIRKAANPMNVIILDACRDNPFGRDVRAEQKGLSQMDAPPATLLAYATAPGNTADDGAGANGLYTENLVREMTVREAKIEDVFKRVRLGVRRASAGKQIPWESTSLEEDFYFLPPDGLKKLSEEEEARAFEEELALFEKARQANDPAPLEGYLRSHPSGRFAELAQLQLDRVLAAQGEKPIEIAPAAGNPNTAGTALTDTKFRVGDRFTYRVTGRKTGDETREATWTITAITDDEVIFDHGRMILDLLGNIVKMGGGKRFTPRQDKPLEYVVGKKWSTRFGVAKRWRDLGTTDMDFKVAARETLTVPAGTFDCFRVEAHGINRAPGRKPRDLYLTYWMAPGAVRMVIAREEETRTSVRGSVNVLKRERSELVSFSQR